jgi:hypothetical protein
MAGMVEALLEKDRAERQGGRIPAEAYQASRQASEAFPDLRGLVERYNFAGLHHTLRYYWTPRRLSFPTVRDP